MNSPVLFYGATRLNGHFSNFAFYNITIDEFVFFCNEQYVIYAKAMLFGDVDVARLITKSKSPIEIKKLGRKVRGFNQKKWDDNVNDIADACNLAKFTQHAHLKELLLATGKAPIAEASVYDRIWGIGVDVEEGKDMSKWRGQNLLGKSLMRVREILSCDEDISQPI